MSELSFAEMPIVGLHAGSSTAPERAFRKWEGTIFHLHELGAVAVLLNQGVIFDGPAAHTGRILGSSPSDLREVTGQRVGSLRDYTGRMAFTGIPTLNQPVVRELLQDKQRFYEQFSRMTARTMVVRDAAGLKLVDDFLGALPGEHAIVKPVKGHEGSGVELVAKLDVLDNLGRRLAQPSASPVLVQEALDTRFMPSGLVCRTDDDKAVLNSSIVAQELRLFSSNTVMTPVLRVGTQQVQDHNSLYVYVDPQSVPESAYRMGAAVIEQALMQCGSDNIFCALDLVYQREEQSWRVMEVNVKEPAMPDRSEGAGIGDMVHRRLAEQLYGMASVAL